MAGKPEYDEYAREGEEQRCHDDAGIGVALELRRHHDIYQDDDEDGQGEEIAERVLLVFVATRKLDRYALGNIHCVDSFLGGFHNLAHRHILHEGRYGDDALAVLTLDGGRSEALHHSAYVAHTHGVTRRVVD